MNKEEADRKPWDQKTKDSGKLLGKAHEVHL